MSAAKKKRLGRGLNALLGDYPVNAATSNAVNGAPTSTANELPVGALQPGRYQPRLTLADDSLAELADSIREQGVLQPLVVRAIASTAGTPSHEIVAGERRWRAAQIAGLSVVPVIIRDLDDQAALAVALIENLQREDLNPIEQANSLSRLAEEFSLTHQQVADAVGRSRSGVTNLLRLLELQEEVRALLASGNLDMGHARALLPLPAAQQLTLAQRTVRSGWSVRQVEEKVRRLQEHVEQALTETSSDLQTRWLQEQLGRELGGKVMLKRRSDGSYKLDVAFTDLGDLQGVLGKIQELVAQLHDTAGPRVRDAAGS